MATAEVLKRVRGASAGGGTPGRPPIGYLNVRDVIEGREIRTIEIDPERAWLITPAFTTYATGDYSLSELGAILEAKGPRSRPRRGKPVTALGPNRVSSLLRSDYYHGIVRYAGQVSPGPAPAADR